MKYQNEYVTDIDGYSYKTVKIGNQIWMAENLNVTRFRNGDIIPEVRGEEIPDATRGDEWEKAGNERDPAWCYYYNYHINGEMYGKLYNWYAVNDPRGLAPEGWQVASHEAWTELIDYLGGEDLAGFKMKSNSGWLDNGNGTNQSGFFALPGGGRYYDGDFNKAGGFGHWWSSSEGNTLSACAYTMNYADSIVSRFNPYKRSGFSVRCLRDD